MGWFWFLASYMEVGIVFMASLLLFYWRRFVGSDGSGGEGWC
ncbi:hypothetical protein A2U01_0107542 [Trifolium medium]|uniref:Uncharacterized protein n=1 Tax=Trifolium medium TaxID=97028 RepID=A0A392VFM7_9FABA|nr:hypothetical protein [Trifolium medium]